MKIAEALTESKRLANLIPTLVNQFGDNCIIVNGVKPDRDPIKLLEKIQATITEKQELDGKISFTNTKVKLPCGLTIHEAIIEKASLKTFITTGQQMVGNLRHGKRVAYNETGVVRTYGVDPNRIEAAVNEAAKKLRTLESELQQTNWITDLL